MTITQPIISAGKRPLPDMLDSVDMRDAVVGQCRPLLLEVTTIASGPGGDAITTSKPVQTDGFTIPVDPRKLNLKPEGARKWKSFLMFTLTDPGMVVEDRVKFNGRVYKVVAAWDFSQFGFLKFGILEDFQ